MKVNVTCMDCEITVEEVDGKCVVTAVQGGEVVEEFEIDCNEYEGSEEEVDVDVDDVDDVDDVEDDSDVEEEEELVEESVKTFSKFFESNKKKKSN